MAAELLIDRGPFQTPLKAADLDPAAYAEWVDGHETPIESNSGKDKARQPEGAVWTQTTVPTHASRSFGDSKTPGRRHLRVGFAVAEPVGTVVVVSDAALSVLKPGAAYPGNLGDDSQWLPAVRLDGRQVGQSEGSRSTSLCTWVLPPGTQTRALRFTHTAELADKSYEGTVGGVYVLATRVANLAPLAQVVSRSNSDKAGKLVNGNTDGFWSAWDNIASRTGERSTTIADDPEWFVMSWSAPQSLNGMAFVFPGFESIEIQAYAGPAGVHPRDGADKDWRTLRMAAGFHNYYATALGITWVPFEAPVATRGLRVRITAAAVEARECQTHLKGATNKGKRVWLGEVLAVQDLAERPLESVVPAADPSKGREGLIPVPFSLPDDGVVTLVIDDKDGKRVRNLVSETPFPRGANTAWWDGTDDLGRDLDAAKHGLYRIPGQLVAPGEYRVRGLWHKPIHPVYEFGVYNDGNPPWGTEDHTGAWLANHSAPQSAAFVPAARSPTGKPVVYLGAYVTEGPDGLIWVDLDGHKLGGKKWIGGLWTAAPFLAVDNGAQAVAGTIVYVGSVWETGKKSGVNELRITALTSDADEPVLQYELPAGTNRGSDSISGLAAYNGLLAVSFPGKSHVVFVDARQGKVTGQLAVAKPRGLAFDAQGRLLVLSEKQVLGFDRAAPDATPRVVVDAGLEEPGALAVDADGTLYVSDRGNSHQVKVFAAQGKFLRAIGKPGAPRAGAYDPLHMNNPRGIAVDSNRRVWVAEEDFLPKRVSVWSPDGALVKAFYGPSKYGGGGTLDASDKTRFYYADEDRGTLEFKLDWTRGVSSLTRVLCRRSDGDLKLPFRSAAPETAFYRTANGRTQRYFSNCYNSSPTSGHATGFLFIDRGDDLRPVAGMGRGGDWKSVFTNEAFAARLPEGIDIHGDVWKNAFFFIWCDRNGDGQVQPDEVQTQRGTVGGVTVMPDLAFCVARLGPEKGLQQGVRFAPEFAGDLPTYAIDKGQALLDGVKGPPSSGGDQLLTDGASNVVVTLGARPFASHSISGGRNGQATWSYPNPWPGLHASHEAARPTQPGQVIGATRLLGGLFTPPKTDVGPLWAVNANMGNLYIFTLDGLFVSTVFKDVRQGTIWKMPVAQRGMSLDGLTLHDENFWPTISQTPDGQVYVVDGCNTCLVRLDGMDTIRHLPSARLEVSARDLQRAQAGLVAAELARKADQGGGVLHVARLAAPPAVDGRIDDWPNTWVEIDRSGVGANFNSDSRPYDIRGAVGVCGDRLYAAWQTADPKLLQNSGEMPVAPFKTGGTLELMIGANPAADPARRAAVAGDLRLLVTRVPAAKAPAGTSAAKEPPLRTLALLYRPVAPGAGGAKVPFSSPWRTLEFDRVDDISTKVQFGADGDGTYEISVPLAVLGLDPKPGLRIRGDMGVLRGDGHQTVARIYWSNKATSIMSDVPSEAELLPGLWGYWQFDGP